MTRPEIVLRNVEPGDLPGFFAMQCDQLAAEMAAVPARDKDAFDAHWGRILIDPAIEIRTVMANGEVVGNVLSFERAGVREIGYWLERRAWGQGIATQALAQFLPMLGFRPLHARVAHLNRGSRRVLERCGFVLIDVEVDPMGGVDICLYELAE